MEYNRQKDYYRRKSISIRLFTEENGPLSDQIIFVYCVGTESLYVYNYIRYNRKTIAIANICRRLMNIGLTDDMVIKRMKDLLIKQPDLSYRNLAKLAGINKDRISRFYMMVKRDIHYN